MRRSMIITRGTTPTFDFVIPFTSDSIDEIYITFYQNGETVVEKRRSDVVITDVEVDNTKPITDMVHGDSIVVNDFDYEPEAETEICADVSVKLTQEDTLGFTFHPAAEKNIAVVQIRLLDKSEDAYASDPIALRVYGVLKDGVIERGK